MSMTGWNTTRQINLQVDKIPRITLTYKTWCKHIGSDRNNGYQRKFQYLVKMITFYLGKKTMDQILFKPL